MVFNFHGFAFKNSTIGPSPQCGERHDPDIISLLILTPQGGDGLEQVSDEIVVVVIVVDVVDELVEDLLPHWTLWGSSVLKEVVDADGGAAVVMSLLWWLGR